MTKFMAFLLFLPVLSLQAQTLTNTKVLAKSTCTLERKFSVEQGTKVCEYKCPDNNTMPATHVGYSEFNCPYKLTFSRWVRQEVASN
jgi:hypothetical protein